SDGMSELLLTNQDLLGLKPGHLPPGWTTENAFGAMDYESRRFVGLPITNPNAIPHYLTMQSPALDMPDDFEISLELFAPLNARLEFTLFDSDGTLEPIGLNCGAPRTGTIRGWTGLTKASGLVSKELSDSVGRFTVRRNGQRIEVLVNDELLSAFTDPQFDTLTKLQIGLRANEEPAGFLSCRIRRLSSQAAANTDFNLPDIARAERGNLPAAWNLNPSTTINVYEFKGRKLIGVGGSNTNPTQSGQIQLNQVRQNDDYAVTTEFFAPDGGQLLMTLTDGSGNSKQLQLNCGRPRFGAVRDWYVVTENGQRIMYTHSKDAETLEIRRTGKKIAVRLNSELITSFDAESLGALTQLALRISGARDPAGITSLSIRAAETSRATSSTDTSDAARRKQLE
ncbi:MAG: hypothetical protein KDA69_10425, partial [Planctomycetaceae bacterium]|nr:hypothetical protein [Planctomycetaceae bacterium]